MIITCGNCNKKYKINPDKITADKVKIKCKACAHHIIVEKPQDIHDELSTAPEVPAAVEEAEKREEPQPKKEEFAAPLQSSSDDTEEDSAGAEPASDAGDVGASDDGEEAKPSADEEEEEEEVLPEGYTVNSGADAAAVAYDRSGLEGKQRYRNEFNRAGVDLSPPKRRSVFGLSFKIISVMILVGVVPLAFLGYIAYTQVEGQLRSETEKSIAAAASTMAASAESLYARTSGMVQTLALLPQIQDNVREQQEPSLRGFASTNPWVKELFTIDTKGMNIARSDEAKLIDYSASGFYQEVMAGEKLVEWKNPEATFGDQSLVMALRVMKKGKPRGAVVTAISLSGLNEKLSGWDGGKSGAVFVVNGSGQIITGSGNLTGVDSSHPLIAKFMEGDSGLVYFNWRGVKNVGVIEKGDGPWGLIVLQREKEAFATLEKTKAMGLTGLAFTLLAVFVLALITGIRITQPLKTLADAAYRISVGELDAEIKIKRNDEIGALAEAISNMRDSIRMSVERMRRRR